MLDLHDKLCSFTLRYKLHIEPPDRSQEIKVLEETSKLILNQEEKIKNLEEENSTLKIKLREWEEKEKERSQKYKKTLADFKENNNDLIKLICNSLDTRKHNQVNSILNKIYDIVDVLEEIPEN